MSEKTMKALEQSKSIYTSCTSCERERVALRSAQKMFNTKERLLQEQKRSLMDTIRNYSRNRQRVDNAQLKQRWSRYKQLEIGYQKRLQDCKKELTRVKALNLVLKSKRTKVIIKSGKSSKRKTRDTDIVTKILLPKVPDDDVLELAPITSGIIDTISETTKSKKVVDNVVQDSEISLGKLMKEKDAQIKKLKGKLKSSKDENSPYDKSTYKRFKPDVIESKGKIYFFNPKNRRIYGLTLKYKNDKFKMGPRGRIYSITHKKFINPIKPRAVTDKVLKFLENNERKIIGRSKFGIKPGTVVFLKKLKKELLKKAEDTKKKAAVVEEKNKYVENKVQESRNKSPIDIIEITLLNSTSPVKKTIIAAETLKKDLEKLEKEFKQKSTGTDIKSREIVGRINLLMRQVNQLEQKTGKVIEIITKKTTGATEKMENVNKLLENLGSKTADLEALAKKADETVKELEAVGAVYDKIDQTHRELNNILKPKISSRII